MIFRAPRTAKNDFVFSSRYGLEIYGPLPCSVRIGSNVRRNSKPTFQSSRDFSETLNQSSTDGFL